MKSIIKILFFTLTLILFFLTTVAWAEIKFAVLPRLNPKEIYDMFKPLQDYLSEEAGENVSLIITKNFDEFKRVVKTRRVDLAFSNPLIYVQIKKDSNIKLLALSSEVLAGPKYRGIIIARKDSNINTLQDLKGKKLSFVDQDSLGGHIMQILLFHNAGIDVRKDFTILPFAKKHNNVAHLVFIKNADAGGIRENDFEKLRGGVVDMEQLKIVAYTDYLLNWPVYATSTLKKNIVKKIKDALLKLKPNTPQSEKILRSAQLLGFIPVKDKDYDGLRKAAKIVGAF